ncbi:MAG: Ribosomal RNA small subunit methyltransferase I [Candidatus Anoxychlamydiales bacterium]|nr:Ribosomal RNA small subunit methyltransferase I [Candidatus Anoxychlamydiales bacterium]
MTLILLPNLLDENADIDLYFPKNLQDIVASLDSFIAEGEKNARKFLFKFLTRDQFQKLDIKLLNEHSTDDEIQDLLKLCSNKKCGLISDAGLPCIADPGSKLVYLAHKNNIDVQAIIGPSSIFLALMLSGLNAQRFCFHGYLLRKEDELINQIKYLEDESKNKNSTQVFIEAPYRSDKMLNILRKTLKKDTLLSLSINLTSKDEKVITKKVKDFQKTEISIGKTPTVFLFLA